MDIYDKDGHQRDWAWVVATYGSAVQIQAADAAQGEPVMRIVELREKVGPATQIVKVIDKDKAPIRNIPVLRYWPSAPELPNWTPPPERWFGLGVIGYSNENGDVGFGMGSGDAYDPANSAGASAVWIGEPNTHTDCASGLGWLIRTEHQHLDVTFQLTAGDDEPEPPVPPDDFEAAVLIELRKANYYLEKIATKLEQGWRVVPAYSVEGYSKR